ncbi:MAG: 3,4-dehydroadipyl-CoA semialdehyde dehydrogenase [Propylenella sp.]
MKLENYVAGAWVSGTGEARTFMNPTTGEALGEVSDEGIDASAALDFARRRGTPALSSLTFAERADILRAIADALKANRQKYVDIARQNGGNTASDAAIDIDGGIFVLKAYARYGAALGDKRILVESGQDQLEREPVFYARHVWTSRPGAAVQVNAFNFPSWGMWEKTATAALAGVASVVKPASATAWLAHEMMRDVVAAGVVPEGALSLICGSGRNLVDALQPTDSLAFTGSADTGFRLRSNEAVLKAAPRLSVEADSMNATILGPDAEPSSPVFDLAVREVVKALTVKAGQLCTNIRRILVPRAALVPFRDAVAEKLSGILVGDPALESVRMGPLVDLKQRTAALDGIERLKQEAEVVLGGGIPATAEGADPTKGAFLAPTLLVCNQPSAATAVHETEVFGPCATLMPYGSFDEALDLANRAGGCLVLGLFSSDAVLQKQAVSKLAPWHGRLLIVDSEVGRNHTGQAIVMPQCVHGGPGRAGGGEELGGVRGLRLHMQRSAVQGSPSMLRALAEDAAEAAL